MTTEEINKLDDRTRKYVHDLQTMCDPQGLIRENWRLDEENKGLHIMIKELKGLS